MNKFWIRTPVGLEDFTIKTLKESVELKDCHIGHRSILFQTNYFENKKNINHLNNIRSIDDAYFFIGKCDHINNTKASVSNIISVLGDELITTINQQYNNKQLRTTVSFLGKRNFNRYYVEECINSFILDNCNVEILSNENKDTWRKDEVRLRCHIESESAFLGFGIRDTPYHRRSWRSEKYNGQIHTPVAGAMAQLLHNNVQSTRIIDPFCGSGTLIIESNLLDSSIEHLGYDTNDEAIKISKNASKEAQVNANFFHQKLNLNDFENKSFCVLSNPPWDHKHSFGKNKSEEFINFLSKIIRKSIYTILIIPDEIIAELRKKGFQLDEVFRTRLRGKIVSIVTIN